jgi:hypothetical protein
MNPHDPDNQIQQLFSEQRAADRQRAPSFQRTWQAAMTLAEKPARQSWWLPAMAAASAVSLLVVSVWLWPHTEKPRPTPTATVVVSLSDWTSPTDFLLEPLTSSAFSGSQP